MEDKIILNNRYRDKVYIEKVHDDVYRLVVDVPYDEDFTRYGYDSWPDDIAFVDPSGGPYISVGENTLSIQDNPDYRYISLNVENISVVLEQDNKISETLLKVSSIKFCN